MSRLIFFDPRLSRHINRAMQFALLATVSLVFAAPQTAEAVWLINRAVAGEADDEELIVIEWIDPETEVTYIEAIYKDGSRETWPGNPNPEDGTTSPGDQQMREDLAKQAGGHGYLIPNWQKTPLGSALAGKGPGHYHNPHGDDYGGQSPSSMEFKTPADLAEEAFAGGGVGNRSGYRTNGGSVGSQLSAAAKRGSTGDDDSDGDGARPADGGFWGQDLPGPPELVNPAWNEDDLVLFLLFGE